MAKRDTHAMERDQLSNATRQRPFAMYALLCVGLAGLVLRFVLAAFSTGTNDIYAWAHNAESISVHGVEWMYQNDPFFNHPPLMGWWSVVAALLAAHTGWTFAVCFKLLPCLADICTAAMLFYVVRRKADLGYATLALALFAVNPDSILISGFHGNTDSAAAMLSLAACYFLELHAAPFLAGLALAAAINVKIIPVLLIPVLLVRQKTLRGVVSVIGALAIGIIPFLPALLTSWPAFKQNALDYNSYWDKWGIPLFIQRAESSALMPNLTRTVRDVFWSTGRYVIMSSVLALCALGRLAKADSFQLASCAFALFLILTPGFGVQYTLYVVPVLFAQNLRWATAYAFAAGAFIAAVYFSFWNGAFPLEAIFDNSGFPRWTAAIGLLPWSLLLAFLLVSFRRMYDNFRIARRSDVK